MQPGLLFFTVYCHQPWGIVAPCQKSKAFLSSDILFEDKNSHVNLVVALNTTPFILPNPPYIQRFCFVVLVALFVKLGTLQVVTQNISAAKTRAEHLWISCRNSFPLARLPPRIYLLPPDKWKGNKDFASGPATKENCEVDQVSLCNSFQSRMAIPMTPGRKQNFGRSVL